MRYTGCEGVVVLKGLVEEGQLTGESCLLIRIDNTALLAEKVVINLRTPYLCGEVKALCIPDAICDVIVGNVEGPRGPEDPYMSVMMGNGEERYRPRVPLEKVSLIDIPFKRDAIDIVGPINSPSEVGQRFIPTVVDYAIRHAEAAPLRKIDVETVGEALVNILQFTVPKVLSDQRPQFTPDCMKEALRLLGMKQMMTTPTTLYAMA
ncbi:gypsy retrotransposon integrase 1-like protein [Plakobranchus ocellatus]|uniref:Gypsy retrotransposon integrase 1-like protein n=1 Tax=Plakobranchus ocellatus TaxID=259542 RepID=A0AAV3Z1I4_9GAST|nr:gypsy retrotransposon integrase 1-like protein [Plakobranchus ocellatus]